MGSILVLPPVAGACALVAALASPQVKTDEDVVFFPSPARLDASGEHWVARVEGKVFEPEEDGLVRGAALDLLAGALGIDGEDARRETFLERARAFLVDNERGKEVTLLVGGRSFTCGESGADGHFEGEVRLPAADVGAVAYPREGPALLSMRAALGPGDGRSFEGDLHLIPREGLSVISDIDDTVKVSEVHDREKLIENTFLEPYREVPGMAELYERLRASGAAFHWLSSSPWQLYAPLSEFMRRAGFPAGTFHLRRFRWKDSSFFAFFRSGEEHKLTSIERLLEDYPARRFVLAGDTGEKDPEVYGEIARRHPGRIARILLRDPTGDGKPTPRLEEALAGVPRDRWQVFRDASEIDLGPVEGPSVSRGYAIPLVDLAAQTDRQVVVDRRAGQYLGHPTTVLLEDGRTMLAVYPTGHGRGAILLKRSTDGGRTWSERLPVPESWATSLETPTIHRVVDAAGKRRLIVFSGLHPCRMAVSEDDGRTWTPLAPVGDWGGIVCMGSVVELRDGAGRYMAMFHDDGRFFRRGGKRTGTFTVYKTFSDDGGLTWSDPETVLSRSDVHLCEPGAVRSPDGAEIAVLYRENSRRRNSYVSFSRDEGRTWSAPRELPGSLTGDRHTARYAPDGRLFISFRDTTHESPTRGDWVGWIGTYDDIAAGREGLCRLRLMDNHKGADCAYPGVEVLPDGTFVTTTYGHWVEGEAPFVVSVRFRLEEIDRKLVEE